MSGTFLFLTRQTKNWNDIPFFRLQQLRLQSDDERKSLTQRFARLTGSKSALFSAQAATKSEPTPPSSTEESASNQSRARLSPDGAPASAGGFDGAASAAAARRSCRSCSVVFVAVSCCRWFPAASVERQSVAVDCDDDDDDCERWSQLEATSRQFRRR